jgi:hypothetical protein
MAIRKLMMAELCHRTDNLVEIVRSRRASYAKVLCCGCASMAAMYAIAKVFKSWRGIVKEHGALEPRSMEDIKARDEQVNVWSQVTKEYCQHQKAVNVLLLKDCKMPWRTIYCTHPWKLKILMIYLWLMY